ncbi:MULTISPECIES: GNAT family N-acetyltransferase [unclassified Paenibacillus]|uniref:GNAT family N-acetyltransferase n=1 Tax=unclassified Paenibacillus TaxID=185978 RepID=UPI00041000F6|nr:MULTISPECIES: GNAT family protein [unclassified Paenibacillus]KKC49416.1 acetyltransferase [Paenibacillus sp. D9]CDN41805.1 GCN5-related N-acetyltransferase [Paenibacillus sp. P22]
MNPILIDFPTSVETERLVMRMAQQGDGPMMSETINASLDELRAWMSWAQSPHSVEQAELNSRESAIRFLKREKLRFVALEKASGQMAACVGLHHIDWNARAFEIGYWADSRRAGNGYVTEAVAAICGFAFVHLEARRLEIRCDRLNARSRAIPEKLGFRLEGILQQSELSADRTEWRDMCVYAKLKADPSS